MKQYIARGMAVLVALMMVLSLAGCHRASEKMDEAVYGTLDKVQSAEENNSRSYQETLDDYTARLEKKGKSLAKELTKEAPTRYTADGNTLSKLLKEKTDALMDLYQEGLKELAKARMLSGEPEVDEESEPLYSAYRSAEDGIMDAYQEALRNVK